MTMIERVARAIFDADNGLDGDRIGDMLYEDYRIDGPAENAKEETMMVCRMAARAAIEAMKDAPLDVLGAMFEAMFEDKWDCTQAPMIGAGWDAGIDAALKEGS